MRLSLLLLFAFSPLFGAYVGNPASPGIMNTGFFSGGYQFCKFTSGYLGDYISDKRYVSDQTSDTLDANQTFRHFGLHSQMASASLILLERLEIFGYAGGSKEHATWKKTATVSEMSTALLDFHSAHHFSWSAGAKLILFQWGQTYFGFDYTYFAVPASHKSFFKFLNQLHLPLETEKQTFSIREWQVSGALSSRFAMFTPYGGITYLSSKLNIHSGIDVPPLYYHNKENIGYFYGLTLSLTGRFHLNFERRVRDEFAYSFATIAVF